MTKFGDIINVEKPVLIDFYVDDDHETTKSLLSKVASSLGNTAKVIKIDIQNNDILAEALKIHSAPTFILYKNGEMKWRETGEKDADTLVTLVQEYV